MKLIVAIVLPDDVDTIVRALIGGGFRAPTRINTVGGFLRKGNATLLLAVDGERVDEALSIMRSNVRPREVSEAQRHVSFRGAAFVLPLEQLLHI
ncbi:MAG: cyclic-di-AMP receptor [Chloroflexi bacterium]|nr:cyclic-di-AMP receptor [Chloroflexota bacterium]